MTKQGLGSLWGEKRVYMNEAHGHVTSAPIESSIDSPRSRASQSSTQEDLPAVSQGNGRQVHRSTQGTTSTAPALQHLIVANLYSNHTFSSRPSHIIYQAKVSLTVLEVYHVNLTADELSVTLFLCPTLHTLKLGECIDLIELSKLLAEPYNEPPILCPLLQRLDFQQFRVAVGQTSPSQHYVDMIVSRWRYERRKGIRLSITQDCDIGLFLTDLQTQEIKRCKSEGLHYRDLFCMW